MTLRTCCIFNSSSCLIHIITPWSGYSNFYLYFTYETQILNRARYNPRLRTWILRLFLSPSTSFGGLKIGKQDKEDIKDISFIHLFFFLTSKKLSETKPSFFNVKEVFVCVFVLFPHGFEFSNFLAFSPGLKIP